MPESEWASLRSELEALYGDADFLRRDAGILHGVACMRAAGGRLHALRVDQGSPKSETDFLALNLSRARADAILTSARNLRREAALSHDLSGRWGRALRAMRGAILGKNTPPTCAILTRSGQLPEADHPVWRDGTPKVVLTEPSQESALRKRLGARADVMALPGLTARSACAVLQREGARAVSVEAGPTTASELYQAPPQVDELLLTVCEAPLEARVVGAALPPDCELLRGLTRTARTRRVEGGLPFRFERWRRA